jgi:hypothetical protein
VWLAYGELAPHGFGFNIADAPLGHDVWLSIVGHSFVLRGASAAATVDPEEVLRMVLGGYILVFQIPLDVRVDGVLELTASDVSSVTLAPRLDGLALVPPADSMTSSEMTRAITLAAAARDIPGYGLALVDLNLAYRTTSVYQFVAAYRVLEDLVQAVGGHSQRDWSALHYHLGSSETDFRLRIQPLLDARNAAAHGGQVGLPPGPGAWRLVDIAAGVARDVMQRDDRLPDVWRPSVASD